MLRNILIVGIGSFLGGVLRYLISIVMKNYCSQGFPWATLMVNLLGCLLIGLLFGLFNRYSSINNVWCLLFTTGLCGGFTTFSTFANESVQMLQQGNTAGFLGYVAASIVLGFLLVALGYWLVSKF